VGGVGRSDDEMAGGAEAVLEGVGDREDAAGSGHERAWAARGKIGALVVDAVVKHTLMIFTIEVEFKVAGGGAARRGRPPSLMAAASRRPMADS